MLVENQNELLPSENIILKNIPIGDSTVTFNHTIQSYTLEQFINLGDKDKVNFCEDVANSMKINDGSLTPQQITFFKDCAKLILSSLTVDSPIIIPVKCGFGKSIFIRELLCNMIDYYDLSFLDGIDLCDLPIIIATDFVDDLKRLQNEVQKYRGVYSTYYENGKEVNVPYIYVIEGWSDRINCRNGVKTYLESVERCNVENCQYFSDCIIGRQAKEQENSPILAITNKRLSYMLNSDNAYTGMGRYTTFFAKDAQQYKRNILLIDEKPPINHLQTISTSDIITLQSQIYSSNRTDRQTKSFIYNELQIVHKAFEKAVDDFADYGNAYVLFDTPALSNQFYEAWHSVFGYENTEKIDTINDVILKGGFLCNYRKKQYFYSMIKNKFNTADLKTFIFDGTASLSSDYNNHVCNFVYLDIDDYKNFSNLTFNVIDESFSKTSILRHPKKLKAVAKWINRAFSEPTYVVSPREAKSQQSGKIVQISNELTELLKDNTYVIKNDGGSIPYFGSTKGKNTWRECVNMVQIGWNKYDTDTYIAQFIATNEQFRQTLIDEFSKEVEKQKDYFKTNHDGTFVFPDLEKYRVMTLAGELEQEIYRTKIRYFGDCGTKVDVYLFQLPDPMRKILKQRFKGCKFAELKDIKEFDEFKVTGRQGNEHVERFIEWIDTKWDKCPVAISFLKRELAITDKQWQYLYNKSNAFTNMLMDRYITVNKRGNKYFIEQVPQSEISLLYD